MKSFFDHLDSWIPWVVAGFFALFSIGFCAAKDEYKKQIHDFQIQAFNRGYGVYTPDEHGVPQFKWKDESSKPVLEKETK